MPTDFEADLTAISDIPAVAVILDVLCRTTGMGFAAVARVTEDRWVACGVRDIIGFGLETGGELKVETTLCHEVRASQLPVVIDNVAEDPIYSTHHTPRIYGLQSYVSMPIVLPDGTFFGTLCAIDPQPRRLNTPETLGMFKLFADLIGFHLDAIRRLAASEARILGERESSELREQFIAVLGHDLRNPVASLDAGTRLLQRGSLSADQSGVVTLMRTSIARMGNLIDNMLDFARGRLGGGLPLDHTSRGGLNPVLENVIDELRAIHSERPIDARLAADEEVVCDAPRIGQLLSNLLANALAHGDPDGPVRIETSAEGDVFSLSVTNTGAPIAPETAAKLFQPFFRFSPRAHRQGLGLGLYIASEIARAHNGTLDVVSDSTATTFTLRMPTR